MLPDCSRLHVVIPDIIAERWAVNIRKFIVRANHLDELVILGTLTAPAAASTAARPSTQAEHLQVDFIAGRRFRSASTAHCSTKRRHQARSGESFRTLV
jgi:hypothetical protein